MAIETIDGLKKFLQARGEDAAYAFWLIDGYKLNRKIIGEKGYVPEGISEFAPSSYDDLLNHLCEKGEEGRATVFQVVNLDMNDKDPKDLVMSAVRLQGFPEHDAMLLFSASADRLAATKAAIEKSPLPLSQAVILIVAKKMLG